MPLTWPDPCATPLWFAVCIETRADTVEAMADFVRATFDTEPVQLLKPGVERAWIEVYWPERDAAEQAARALRHHPDVRGLSVRTLAPKDWTNFWRRHFHARPIGERLMIVPEWERVPKDRRRRLVRIAPGLAFGTGDHFTTRFCLEAIERACRENPPASLLDAGCGSGILAVAAARLGVPRVVALDHDEAAVAQTRENARLNRVAGRIRVFRSDLMRQPIRGRYDLVCANLYAGLLRALAPALLGAARHRLILSGLRECEADDVADTFVRLGAREICRDGDGEWCGSILSPPSGRERRGRRSPSSPRPDVEGRVCSPETPMSL